MDTNNEKTISTLNKLIETCKDGQNGFREAAEGVKDTHLQRMFEEFSQQRTEFVSQLQAEVAKLGGKPEDSGSLSASLHRGWIDLKSAITGGSDSAITAECERGEDVAKKAYKDALDEPIPADVRSLVERQYIHVKETHDRVRNLEVKTQS